MKILILGAGRMGSAIATLLHSVDDYSIFLADKFLPSHVNSKIKKVQCDIEDEASFDQLLKTHAFHAIISCLPYYCNINIAKKAKEYRSHYFDLTEDIKTTEAIEKLATDAKTVFISHCGLAPGFVNIAASHLIQKFEEIDTLSLRVGGLPQYSNNALHYALTWSTEGLINEYGNSCESIVDGKLKQVKPLEDLENVTLDGVEYECFNTSGGLGSLWQSFQNKVKNMNYKTIRYPGHCEKIKFLMNDLQLNHHRETLKKILEESIPMSDQDVVLIYIAVLAKQNNQLIEEIYFKKLYPAQFIDQTFTALQLSTASSVCAVVDMILTKQYDYVGFVKQEQFCFKDFLQNRFGKYYGVNNASTSSSVVCEKSS